MNGLSEADQKELRESNRWFLVMVPVLFFGIFVCPAMMIIVSPPSAAEVSTFLVQVSMILDVALRIVGIVCFSLVSAYVGRELWLSLHTRRTQVDVSPQSFLRASG